MMLKWLGAPTTNALALIECSILFTIAIFGGLEIREIKEQHRLERVAAGKTSMQAVNSLILGGGNEIFLEVLYPNLSPAEAKKMTAAYASLHALEVLYETSLTERPEENPDKFLGAYLSHPVFKQLWDIEAYHIAFGERFRAAVDRHFTNTD